MPSVTEGRRVAAADLTTAFRAVDVPSTRRHAAADDRATEVLPRQHACVLGRTLTAWGLPVGENTCSGLPAVVTTAPPAGKTAFLRAYIRHRSVNYEKKATTRLQSTAPTGFHDAIAALLQEQTGETATPDKRGVTVSAAAMRTLALAEESA